MLVILGLQQIFNSCGYSLEFWHWDSKINIWHSFAYVSVFAATLHLVIQDLCIQFMIFNV